VPFPQTIEQISQSQKERLDRVSVNVTDLTQRNGEQQDLLRKTVEERLDAIPKENTEKLDQMRQTVDEKLQSSLDQRLGASFQIVADRLEQVYKSMGEMQTLASGVGDLKRLLTNVKSRSRHGRLGAGRCPPTRVAHHGGRADHPRLALSVAAGWLQIARHPKPLERSLEGAGGG
jgi:DNA anti-recombination protein RmuC